MFSQSHLDYGKVLADKGFLCDTNKFKQELCTYYKSSTGVKTICQSKNELEIRLYTTWSVIPGWSLYIITYHEGQWNAQEYWYNFGRKTFDTLQPVKTFSLKPDYSFDSLFRKVKQNNIFTLPDAWTIKFEDDCSDPPYNVITYKVKNKFRKYRVDYPCNYQEKYPKVKTFEYYNKLLDIFFKELKRQE